MAAQWVTLLLLTAAATTAAAGVPQSQVLPGCQEMCGNISIPYPFGLTENCYISPPFFINCDKSYNPPKAYIGTGNVEVIDMSSHGEIRARADVAYDCYYKDGTKDFFHPRFELKDSIFTFSDTRNDFTAVGCDTAGFIWGFQEQPHTSGCVSLCSNNETVRDGLCSGIGCCHVSIPQGLTFYNLSVTSFNEHRGIWDFNPCSYAFVAEKTSFQFSRLDLQDLGNRKSFPVVLDWVIDKQTCDEAAKNHTSFACQHNSQCYNSTNGPGYRCKCSKGFQGNPYLPHGCIDVNECANQTLNDCIYKDHCHNAVGNYSCSCPKGYHGDGKNASQQGCVANKRGQGRTIIKITAGVATIVIALVVCSSCWLYLRYEKKKLELKAKFFEQNGGLRLLQTLVGQGGAAETIKIFTSEELKEATNNYDETTIIGGGGFGTVYKGILAHNRQVAIKKLKIVDESLIDQYIKEVVVLSQINHKNMVKLLGCCLEERVPIPVYEFITNGSLFSHLHDQSRPSTIPWTYRLRIAAETAGVLSYLHSAASHSIIHGDVKSANILLDDSYIAKVTDFGLSRFVASDDRDQLSRVVQGTIGYLDPEYLQTNEFTTASDVYSFGVVLVELLTGIKAYSFEKHEKEMFIFSFLKRSTHQKKKARGGESSYLFSFFTGRGSLV